MARTTPDPNLTGYPPGIKYIIGNEGCERFSYYGMRAILYVYIVGLYINLSGMDPKAADAEATAAYHLFGAAVYALPLIGAMLADRLLGKYYTILSLSVVYCLGHLALAIFEDPNNMFGVDPITGLYIGLGLIAVGSGGIKPCVSAHVGDQFGKSNWHLLQKIYNAFYFIINFGSAFSTILIPIIRGKELSPGVYEGSVSWAFGVPGILMGVATIFFWMGRNAFVHVPPTHPGKRGLLDVLAGTALFMVIGWWIFFQDMTEGWVIDVAVSGVCLVAFVVLFNIRQRIEADDGFLALTFEAVKARALGKGQGAIVGGLIVLFELILLLTFSPLVLLYLLVMAVFGKRRPSNPDTSAHWFYGPVAQKHGSAIAEGPIAVWKIMSVFIFISVFWALFDQHSSTWIAQAKVMDRVIDLSTTGCYLAGLGIGLLFAFIVALSAEKDLPLWAMMATGALMGPTIYWMTGAADQRSYGAAELLIASGTLIGGTGLYFGIGQVTRSKWVVCASFLGLGAGLGYVMSVIGAFELQASQVPALNPFMVMVLIPLTTFGLYPLLEKFGLKMHPLRRMTMGMLMAGVSFVLVAMIQQRIDAGQTVHIGWQVIPYLVITLAEVMVSITGLEFAYSQAPKRMKSVIMGFWLFNVSLGNVLVAVIAKLPDMEAELFFWTFAGLMFAAGGLFALRGKFYTYKDYTQDGEEPGDKETAETFA